MSTTPKENKTSFCFLFASSPKFRGIRELRNKLGWQPIIGLEIHVELKTESKMFCRCSADYFGHKPNTHCCPVCLGLPGALPVANKKAIEWTVLAGLALKCQISVFSKFDRKNYFYPDLPKGYQISQYDLPLAINGGLTSKDQRPKTKVRIRRVHLEEDTAKMIHTKVTLLDFNRSGVPLMEIVTEPDIHSAQEAKEFLRILAQIIRYLGISDCDMEKGTMRLEANVSVKKLTSSSKDTSDGGRVERSETSDSSEVDEKLPSYKVEIKNLNSFKFVEKAIDYEIKRQIQMYEKGKVPIQETRGWDEKRQVTFSQRVKEEAQDYRYFPEPDLPPIRWKKSQISNLKSQISELPEFKMTRFVKNYGLTEYNAKILTAKRETADYFEEAVKLGKDRVKPSQIANVIINKRADIAKISPSQLVQALLKKRKAPKISKRELVKIIKQVLKENQKAVEDYKKGKTNAIQFLIGQVMAKTKERADTQEAEKLITKGVKDISP